MKKTLRPSVLCVAILALASAALLAQTITVPGTVAINGGKTTVALKAQPSKRIHHEPAGGFYSNFSSGSSPYVCNVGYTVSDGSPINTEYTPASQFVSTKTGTTARIRIAVGFVTGTNGGTVILDKDCGGMPCGTVDKTHLCKVKLANLPTFGQSCTQIEKRTCVTNLVKNHKYWVYVQSLDNSWDAWNLANTATGTTGESTNDGAWSTGSGGSLGAFAIQ